MKITSPEIFNINEILDNNWKLHLENFGYVVIGNILSNEKKEEIYQQFKNDINLVSPNFNFNDNKTWTIENTPVMFSKGMGVFNGFGQSDFMWMLRQDQNIQSIYKSIYQTDELITSFDGFSFYVSNKQKSKPWLHVDQNQNNTTYSIQGQYNFFPVNENDAGFIVIPETHKTFIPNAKPNKDWYVLNDNELENLEEPTKLIIPSNCFTLWNSKLVHANTFMTKKNPTEINRVTAYVTFLPKNLQTDQNRKKRIEVYKNSKTTSHWANKCEIKTYPYGFGFSYDHRGYNNIIPKLENNNIPINRLSLI